MKTKALALLLLASSSMFADWRVGIGVGPVYRPPARVYVAPPPVYVSPYRYVAPTPYVRGYWDSGQHDNRWRESYYDRDWRRDRHYDRDRHHDYDRDHDHYRHHDYDRDHDRHRHHDRDHDRNWYDR